MRGCQNTNNISNLEGMKLFMCMIEYVYDRTVLIISVEVYDYRYEPDPLNYAPLLDNPFIGFKI